MKILFFETDKEQEALFKAALPSHTLSFFSYGLQDATTIDYTAEAISIFVCSLITQEVVDKFPHLKFIVVRATGFDNIDIKAASKRGITVCNVPMYADVTVAEYTFGLLLALSRHICQAVRRVADNSSFSLTGLQGFDLHGKTLGVVGTGNIGRHVMRIGRAFGMQVNCYDIAPDSDYAHKLGCSYVDFYPLLGGSDIITLHVPLNEKTNHLINKEAIYKCKKGSYLINTSRGAIVQTDALVEGLQKNILSGAALDVLEEECFTQDPLGLLTQPHPQKEQLNIVLENHYLMHHPRVIISPHNAFNSRDAVDRLLTTTIQNIHAWCAEKPINVVNK